ncbi:MAG: prepilin-type N-terminal cleavage/methylation domain-containing protein [Candidatus Manganitrophaceae bacterium]|nr:MAG: prepilin-type N-terminal cleavage/methylation domain-containing protein [Candidatus Manganitrophaceae bacterium]
MEAGGQADPLRRRPGIESRRPLERGGPGRECPVYHICLQCKGLGMKLRIADCGLRRKNQTERTFSFSIRNPQSEIRNRRSGGFTLLEVLLSLAILAVLFTLVYGSFNSTYRASEQLEKEADSYRLARLGFYHLAKDLSMIYQTKPAAGPSPPVGTAAKNAFLFQGEDRSRTIEGTEYPDDSIRFTAVSHGRTLRDAPESDWAMIFYHLEEGLLIHEEALLNERVIRNEIGEDLLGINFRYLDKADRSWVNQWDSEVRKELPLAVEIELILKGRGKEGRRFKTTVELPMARRS